MCIVESSAYISVLQFEINGLSQTNCKANSISMKEICPNEFIKKNVKKNIAHNLNIIFNVYKTIDQIMVIYFEINAQKKERRKN